jgi:hypothetical protein
MTTDIAAILLSESFCEALGRELKVPVHSTEVEFLYASNLSHFEGISSGPSASFQFTQEQVSVLKNKGIPIGPIF